MGRKIVRFFVTIFILILLISAITFGVLFYVKNNEVVTATQRNEALSSELAVAKQKVTELETTCTGECPVVLEFVDQEQGIEFEYPVSWKIEVNTEIGDLVETGTGRIISTYQIIAIKGDAQLIYDRILIATGFTPNPVDSDDDFEVINDEAGRLRRSGNPDWSYVSYDSCDEEISAEYCYVPATPGFGEGAKVVTLKGTTNADVIAEADAIVLSAQ